MGVLCRFLASLALLLGAHAARAQCPFFPTGWPAEATIEPGPAVAGQALQVALGPPASVGIFQPVVARNGNVVTLQGRFQDFTGIGVPPPPAPFVVPIGSFTPGQYVLRVALLDSNVPNPCPVVDFPFVVTGAQAPVAPVPIGRIGLAALAASLWLLAIASRAARSRRCRSR